MPSYHSTQQRDSRWTPTLGTVLQSPKNQTSLGPSQTNPMVPPVREAIGTSTLARPGPNPPECQPPPIPHRSPKRRRGALGVQWNNSKERQFVRLYEMTDCRIEDIPVVMRDSELKFEKRHAQDKLSTLLNGQPKKYHPIGNEAQSRVEISLGLKQAFKEKHGLQETQPNYAFAVEHDNHGIGQHFADRPEIANSPFDLDDPLLGELIAPPRESFGVLMDNFATQRAHGPYGWPDERSSSNDSNANDNRTSLSNLQALEERMTKRPIPKDGHQLMQMLEDNVFIFELSEAVVVNGQLLANHRRFDDHSFEKELECDHHITRALVKVCCPGNAWTGLGNDTSVDIRKCDDLAPGTLGDGDWIQNIGCDLEQATGTSMDGDRLYVPQQDIIHCMNLAFPPPTTNITPSKGLYKARMDPNWPLPSGSSLPTIKPSVGNNIKTGDKSPGPFTVKKNIKIRDKTGSCCMVTLRRGDPRASLCAACKLMEPDPHSFVRRTVKQSRWQFRMMTDLDEMYRARGFLENDIHEVDMFHDTVLHEAACFGAGSEILLWLIGKGVDIHKANAAGQTFMHVLKPTAFNGSQPNMFKDGFPALLSTLQEQSLKFSRRDDYRQTPLHVLTQYWLHSDSVVAAFNGMDFRNRTINSQLFAQSNKEFETIIDQHRRSRIGDFVQLDCPSLSVRSDPADRSKFLNLALSKATILSALAGERQADFSGRNALHCFAQYWFCESTFPALPASDQFNTLKRKYPQRDLLALRACNARMIRNLCAAGTDINDYDVDGNTPFMVLVKNETVEMVDRQTVTEACLSLIQNGANVHRQNRKGETILHMAMALGRTAIVEVLLENHANKNSRISYGKGILEVATKSGIRRGPDDSGLYAKSLACINIAVRHGAVEGPDTKLEWDEQIRCSSLTNT
ncbi:hypothetical protein BJ875DRAFT_447273 [Amylocarpus encephaloides]|uniref:Clr5 domain-containing protein n=1 Tax=Amylocarpus encephaloides TaxID=45428 RepID=A0A9P7Y5W8_9HELO|nr:hypothetical protein BJ875DRAFT_447273 [Amylocarpus encephaloides]